MRNEPYFHMGNVTKMKAGLPTPPPNQKESVKTTRHKLLPGTISGYIHHAKQLLKQRNYFKHESL